MVDIPANPDHGKVQELKVEDLPEVDPLIRHLSEEQMIEVAEKLFVTIAKRLKEQSTTIKQVFNKPEYITVIPNFEDEKDVATVLPTRLIEGL
jgi:hypothetical protein